MSGASLIWQAIAESCRHHRDGVALVDEDGRTTTYADLLDRVERAAVHVRTTGWQTVTGGVGSQPWVTAFVLACSGACYVPCDDKWPAERISSIRNLIADANLDGAAYVLFTSGTTGTPKGVVQSAENAVYHARIYAASIGLMPGDRIAAVAGIAYDAALMDVLGGLLAGAEIHFFDPRRGRSRYLFDWAHEMRINVLHGTPTLFRLASRSSMHVSSVRCVVFGGERSNAQDVASHREHFDAELVNGYGPTECTTALQARHCERFDEDPPLGDPIGNVSVSVDDGEIVLHGPVALRYLGGSEFRGVYRTGDLAERTPRGLMFVGRRDRRMKVLGYGVDLDELDAMTLSSGVARQCRSRIEGGVLIMSTDAEPNALFEWAHKALPSHMVPRRLEPAVATENLKCV